MLTRIIDQIIGYTKLKDSMLGNYNTVKPVYKEQVGAAKSVHYNEDFL